MKKKEKTCVIIGASHAGVNCAFALRKEGWQGAVVLIDSDPELPYHRPPLSKTYLNEPAADLQSLKPLESYHKNNIKLLLDKTVSKIDSLKRQIILYDGTCFEYTKLVLATGAKPIIPPIEGLKQISKVFTLRTAGDITSIKNAFFKSDKKKAAIIGGGYIGLETAASLKKMGAEVTVLERESRILARVTSSYISNFFQELHKRNGVDIQVGKNVFAVENYNDTIRIYCDDATEFDVDILILGVGVKPNCTIASKAELKISDGILVDEYTQTSNEHIYAIGDVSYHYNKNYGYNVRLESVQNAVEQSKIAALNIAGKKIKYDTIPWFWSDQFDIKLQIVGLANGYTDVIVREDDLEKPVISVWYFKDETLLAVDAINNAKAYVFGTKFLKNKIRVDKAKLKDISVPINNSLEVN
ncbi:NAD(FAD)-dependent dehydrogenase [Galbibacter orientalis DSM 19592]|uniref:NAD(FAD)-dependent dehydrogenase n=1 Tax=Galbibacter orientalis DSM 19592 TaxID=926559 RepID=I3CAU5_9FLAO|nr:FAD/NAD(P)-binding oxidoreductase [Galbibacter orientalis]EIJ40738.1 NAD(FAD)-dependent dehydrogenase [Galbibacter orientalis DSM 19592]